MDPWGNLNCNGFHNCGRGSPQLDHVMDVFSLLTAAAAFSGLLLGGVGVYLGVKAGNAVQEPVELRALLGEYDQALTDHQQRSHAWYARVSKRLKELQPIDLPSEPAATADDDELDTTGAPSKAELWRRANALRAMR